MFSTRVLNNLFHTAIEMYYALQEQYEEVERMYTEESYEDVDRLLDNSPLSYTSYSKEEINDTLTTAARELLLAGGKAVPWEGPVEGMFGNGTAVVWSSDVWFLSRVVWAWRHDDYPDRGSWCSWSTSAYDDLRSPGDLVIVWVPEELASNI